MNHWKTAFWICFVAALAILALEIYSALDKSVSLTYMQQGYIETENDLKVLVKIFNETDLSKREITNLINSTNKSEYVSIEKDKITLARTILTFENDRLKRIDHER